MFQIEDQSFGSLAQLFIVSGGDSFKLNTGTIVEYQNGPAV
jgi:hypothetical protein